MTFYDFLVMLLFFSGAVSHTQLICSGSRDWGGGAGIISVCFFSAVFLC